MTSPKFEEFNQMIEEFIIKSKEFTEQEKLDCVTAVLSVVENLKSYQDFSKLKGHEKGKIDFIAENTFLSKSTIGDIITGRGKPNGKLITDDTFKAIFEWQELQEYIFENYDNGIVDELQENFNYYFLRTELKDRLKLIDTQTLEHLGMLAKQQLNRISVESMLFIVFSDWFFKSKQPLKFYPVLSNEKLFTLISENIIEIENSLELVDVNDIDKKLDFIARIDSTNSWDEINEFLNQKELEQLMRISNKVNEFLSK
ncbi:TPA: hypothetical protein U1B27_001239 [Streptococcus suis]|nr:hypothetical protein [Streptococcus suis]HEM3476729.1 hypothetical protein [Streptococcus suis]HEM3483109.1 hypothetical protein [Streptococcus suis]